MENNPMQAALLAMSEVDASSRGEAEARKCVEAAILAFLDAAMGDEGVVESLAEAVADAMNMNRVGRLEIDAARAALSALKGEVKP